MAARGERIDYCIVGEPSSVETLGDMIKNGRRGTLSGTLTVRGVQGHIAYPHLARNPDPPRRRRRSPSSRHGVGRGQRLFSADDAGSARTSTRGTGATNVIPGTLELHVQLPLFAGRARAKSLQQRFEAILQRHGLDYDLDVDRLGQAVPDAARACWSTSPRRPSATSPA